MQSTTSERGRRKIRTGRMMRKRRRRKEEEQTAITCLGKQ